MWIRTFLTCAICLLFVACSSTPPLTEPSGSRSDFSEKGNEVTLFALALIDTGYRFGGKNPEAGLDCSGMVSYIYKRAAGLNITGSAAEMARQGRAVERHRLRAGDLVFFNTNNTPYSHVGVYLGNNRFIHAPSSNGKVRIDHLNTAYYAKRFELARTYFD